MAIEGDDKLNNTQQNKEKYAPLVILHAPPDFCRLPYLF